MNYLHIKDLPENIKKTKIAAIDTETMGLNLNRDKLCMVQISFGDKNAHLVKVGGDIGYKADNLKQIMSNKNITKVFHYARFDMAIIKKYLGIIPAPIFCTKIASKLVRTYTDKHGLKELCKELCKLKEFRYSKTKDENVFFYFNKHSFNNSRRITMFFLRNIIR